MSISRNSLVIAFMFGLLSATTLVRSAEASVVNASEFEIIQTDGAQYGRYTVINNSGQSGSPAEYIYGVLVINSLSSNVTDATTRRSWTTQELSLGGLTEFVFDTQPGTFHGSNFVVNPVDISPGNKALGFTLSDRILPDSTITLLLVDAQGDFSTYTTTVATAAAPAVPEPSTWAMMLLGFGGLGLFGYWRNRRLPISAA